MALTTCPDCGHEVSVLAPACPSCGRPLAATTVEQTGKEWKVCQILGVLIIIGGAGTCAVSVSSSDEPGILPIFAMIGGLLLFIMGRLGAWWHHG